LVAVPDPVLFGESGNRRLLTIEASGCPGPLPLTIEDNRNWIRTDPSGGTLSPGVPFVVEVVLIRSRLSPGLNRGQLTITSGASSIEVTVEAID
jgi:hypothetical protein